MCGRTKLYNLDTCNNDNEARPAKPLEQGKNYQIMVQYSNLNEAREIKVLSNGTNSKNQMRGEPFFNKVKVKCNILLVVGLSLLIVSCSPQLAMLKTQPKPNDIIISPEMKAFSTENRSPAVVLRVPNTASNVSEAEQKNLSKYNNVYNQIEKNLLRDGFTVRDRGLLNNLLASGQTNYAEIGAKIQTDIIIEILSIDFAIDNYCHTAILKKSNTEISIPDNMLNPQISKLECKLTIVNKGLTGSVLSLYYTPCTHGCDFLFDNIGTPKVALVGSDQFYPKINWTAEHSQESLDNTIAYFSSIIASILRGNTGRIGYSKKINPMTSLPEITSIEKGTPADDVFQTGDVILKINGESTFNKTDEELDKLILGEAGTKINFTIKRGNSEFEKTVTKINRY